MAEKRKTAGKTKSKKTSVEKKSSRVKAVTLTQLSQLINVSPSAVSKHLQTGALIRSFDGTIDILSEPNKTFLKNRGVSACRVKIPNARPTGRPAAGPRPGTGTITTPAGPQADGSTSELRRVKTISKCLHLQEKRREERKKHIHIDKIKSFESIYLDAWKRAGDGFVKKATSTIFDHFGVKPAKAQREAIRAAITREITTVYSARVQVLKKFTNSIDKRKAGQAQQVPAKMKKKADAIPAPLQGLVVNGFEYRDLDPLAKSDIDRVRLLCEIMQLKQKIGIARGQLVNRQRFHLTINKLFEIDTGLLHTLPQRLSGDIAETLKTNDENIIFELQNKLMDMTYEPAQQVKQAINNQWT